MKLRDWLSINGMLGAQLAELLGCTPQTISGYLKKNRIPRKSHMRKIYYITRGLVTPNDFYGVDAWTVVDTLEDLTKRRYDDEEEDED